MLGEKLPEGLSIGLDQTFTSDATNYMPFEDITVRCLSDRRICTITGTSWEATHAAVEQDLQKKYGQGNPTQDNDGKISAIKWSDGNREIELSGDRPTEIFCHDIALEKTADKQLQLTKQEALHRQLQAFTGAFGYTLGERLPDRLPIDPFSHTYYHEATTNYWPFKDLTAFCLSDRRIFRIGVLVETNLADFLKKDLEEKFGPGMPFKTNLADFLKKALEERFGPGVPLQYQDGKICGLKWSEGNREIELRMAEVYDCGSICYRDRALTQIFTEESARSEQEAVRRLLQPITGAFGYTLGEKLGDGLSIDPDILSYYDQSPNFPFIRNALVECSRDRRICSIIGQIASGQFDVAKNTFEKKYGLGRAAPDGGEMWSDGEHEIYLMPSFVVPAHITCSDPALRAQWRKVSDEAKAFSKLFQPITGAFGYTLGEKLPEGLSIDPESHSYAPVPSDSTTNYLSFFPIVVDCLSDRRICRITGTVGADQIDVVRAALEKKYGKGRLEGHRLETWEWGNVIGRRIIDFNPPIISYEDEELALLLGLERDREKQERQKASLRGL